MLIVLGKYLVTAELFVVSRKTLDWGERGGKGGKGGGNEGVQKMVLARLHIFL